MLRVNPEWLKGIGMISMRTRKRLIERLSDRGIEDAEVLEVIQSLPRHLFLDEALAHRAYEDCALPIGYGQTLSQPYIVARMTSLLRQGRPMQRVLEVGTGSGYQAAVLALLADRVYSIERLEPLHRRALQRFKALGLRNIHCYLGDGFLGLPDLAPFDAILAACAPQEVPPALLQQLHPEGGLLLLPVGEQQQSLMLIERQGDFYRRQAIEDVYFVPLITEAKPTGEL